MKTKSNANQFNTAFFILAIILLTIMIAFLMAQSDGLYNHSFAPLRPLPVLDENPASAATLQQENSVAKYLRWFCCKDSVFYLSRQR